jgi:TP901 family phage tail tape measure protein
VVDFRIQVIVDPAKASSGSRKVRGELDKTTASAGGLQRALTRAFAVVASGAALFAVTRTLAGFSQEMSTVGAVANATAAQFAALEEKAISLGTNTRFSATQAAEGMTFLARAGFTADEVLGSISGTLQLAQAGALGLGEAADIASNVLKGMRLEVDETARVVDVLALAANSSNTTVSQLGQALKFVAPIAAGVGVEIEETTAAISALSDAGLQASTAGTGLRRVLATLEQGGPALAEALNGTGISVDDVKISSVGLTTALERMAQAGIDTGTALQIFGQRGGPAFEVLKFAGGDIKKFADRLREADGTAARISTTMDDNLNGSLLALRSAFEGVILRAGQNGAQGALRGFVDTLTEVLRTTADNIGTFINVVEGLVFVLSVRLASQAIPAAIAGIKALGVAIATNPIGAIATAITLVVGALIGLRDELTLTSDSFTTLSDVATAAFTMIKATVDSFVPLLTEVANGISEGLGDAFEGFEFNLQNVLLFMATFADTSLGIFLALGNSLTALFLGLPKTVGSGIFQVLQAINNFIEKTIDVSTALFTAISSTAKNLGLSLLVFFGEIDVALTQLAQGQVAAAKETATQAKDVLLGQLEGTGATFMQKFRAELTGEELTRTIEEIVNPFEGAGGEMAADMTKGFEDGLATSGITDFVLATFTAADAIAAQSEALAAQAAAQTTANEETAKAVELQGLLAEETDMVEASVGSLSDQLSSGLKSGLDSAIKGITDVSGAAENLVVNAFGAAEDAIVDFATTGEFNVNKLVDGILADLARLLARQAISGLLSTIGGGAGGGGLASFFSSAGSAEGGKEDVQFGDSIVVGEGGKREVFTPPGAGDILSASKAAAIANGDLDIQKATPAPPPVNVTIVNTTDPADTLSAMNTAAGTELIMNTILNNPSVVKNALQ